MGAGQFLAESMERGRDQDVGSQEMSKGSLPSRCMWRV